MLLVLSSGWSLEYVVAKQHTVTAVRQLQITNNIMHIHWQITNNIFPQHTHPFNGPLSATTRVGWYQKGKTNLDFTEARDIEWQWHHLGHMQVCTLLQADNHASTPLLSFLQAGWPSCRPMKNVKALKAFSHKYSIYALWHIAETSSTFS